MILHRRKDLRLRRLVGEPRALAYQRCQREMDVVVPQPGHQVRAIGVEVAVPDTCGRLYGGYHPADHGDVQGFAVWPGSQARHRTGSGNTKALHKPEFCHEHPARLAAID